MEDHSTGEEGDRDPRQVGVAARLAMAAVRVYQRVFSFRPSPCRFVPSCSYYSLDAFELHGFWKGLWMTARRIGRCNPWGGHGWDPVPGCEGSHDHGSNQPLISQDAA